MAATRPSPTTTHRDSGGVSVRGFGELSVIVDVHFVSGRTA
jgi:hypothetical protein